MKNCALVLALAFGLAACGDDASPMDSGVDGAILDGGADGATLDGDVDSGMADASVDGDVDSGTPDAGPPACAPAHLLAVTSDFTTAEGALFDTAAGSSETLGMLADQDSAPTFAGCRSFLLQRGIGHLLALDGVATSLDVDLNETGVTDSYAANPQTVIEISDTEVWVPLAARNAIVRVNPMAADAASAVLGEVDLSPYMDAVDTDGLVDASDGLLVGDRVYVALGRYFFDTSYAIHFDAGSVIAVFDAATATPIDMDDATDGVQGLAVGDNPWRGLHYDADTDTLWVGASGDSFATDGALQAVDLAATGTPTDLLTETTLGAELNGFAVVSPTRVYVLAGTDVVGWDPVTGAMPGAAIATGVDGMRLMGDTLYTWSRMGAGVGLHSFDAATGAETTPAAGATNFGSLPIAAIAPAP